MQNTNAEIIKSGLSFSDLYNRAKDIQTHCTDYSVSKVSHENMFVDPHTGNLVYIPDDSSEVRRTGLTKHSLSQLCTKLGVPVRYIDKCSSAGRLDLVSDNLNSWLSTYDKNLFIREYDNKARGILSDRYMTLDTPEILEVLSDTIDSDEYTIKGHFLSPERFHARIVQREMMNVAGEDLFAGIQIDSSDVGRSTLSVKFLIFKQVCTNGLCITKGGGMLFEQRHIGLSVDEFHQEFKDSMSRIPTLMSDSISLVESARKKDKTFSLSNLDEITNLVKNNTRVSDSTVEKVISLMSDRYSFTRWGLINSLTEVAQDFTLERRLEIEKYAGSLLTA